LVDFGMAVLMVNYRGSVGNGDNVQQSILGNIGKVAKIS
jgi:dipeptidyl aminopeptidase/acylaminoacyl peptidase